MIMLSEVSVMNLQQDGYANTLSEANIAIAAARRATPEQFRERFRSAIRWLGPKQPNYVWYWVLK